MRLFILRTPYCYYLTHSVCIDDGFNCNNRRCLSTPLAMNTNSVQYQQWIEIILHKININSIKDTRSNDCSCIQSNNFIKICYLLTNLQLIQQNSANYFVLGIDEYWLKLQKSLTANSSEPGSVIVDYNSSVTLHSHQ